MFSVGFVVWKWDEKNGFIMLLFPAVQKSFVLFLEPDSRFSFLVILIANKNV
jgi:hypothetical protein